MFFPTHPAQKFCKKEHISKCPVCGKEIVWNSLQPVPACSKECKIELSKKLMLEKYGVDHPMKLESVKAKKRETTASRYGVEYYTQSEEMKEKIKAHNRKKFGTDWAFSNPEVYAKGRDTMERKYGAPTTLQSEQLKQKAINTCVERYVNEDGSISSKSVFVKYAANMKKSESSN